MSFVMFRPANQDKTGDIQRVSSSLFCFIQSRDKFAVEFVYGTFIIGWLRIWLIPHWSASARVRRFACSQKLRTLVCFLCGRSPWTARTSKTHLCEPCSGGTWTRAAKQDNVNLCSTTSKAPRGGRMKLEKKMLFSGLNTEGSWVERVAETRAL